MLNENSNNLYSKDLAPIPTDARTWNTWNYAALWISMSLYILTYMLASSLIEGGMNWWQAILTIFFGQRNCLSADDFERSCGYNDGRRRPAQMVRR